MRDFIHIHLHPLDKVLAVPRGTRLQDLLFAEGVEFPCGGRGRCRGCKVKVLDGTLPVTAEDAGKFSRQELAEGWRLSCRHEARADLTIEMAQWASAILADDSRFEFVPQQGYGVAVDLGTTTLVAQLLDLQRGSVLAVRTALNLQAAHGADIMSRIEFALAGGQSLLTQVIRESIGSLISELLAAARIGNGQQLHRVCIVGNSVMHHLFCGIPVEPLSRHPFDPLESGWQRFRAEALGWMAIADASVSFLPCMGSFVGSDILAGVLATRLHESNELVALVDLGTNGEIVVGNRERIVCTSTAAGPAFEGARISCGMRAVSGAISEVIAADGGLRCSVLGGGPARGICGSGLVDAVAAALDLDWIAPSGRLQDREAIVLGTNLRLTQADIRELQLAKGAIAAGILILAQEWGAQLNDVSKVYLAGAFGNYINRTSAQKIGLLPFSPEKIQSVGNSALLGAKVALCNRMESDAAFLPILQRARHVSINDRPDFVDIFAEKLCFPVRS